MEESWEELRDKEGVVQEGEDPDEWLCRTVFHVPPGSGKAAIFSEPEHPRRDWKKTFLALQDSVSCGSCGALTNMIPWLGARVCGECVGQGRIPYDRMRVRWL
jgi:hypothetical protein